MCSIQVLFKTWYVAALQSTAWVRFHLQKERIFFIVSSRTNFSISTKTYAILQIEQRLSLRNDRSQTVFLSKSCVPAALVATHESGFEVNTQLLSTGRASQVYAQPFSMGQIWRSLTLMNSESTDRKLFAQICSYMH